MEVVVRFTRPSNSEAGAIPLQARSNRSPAMPVLDRDQLKVTSLGVSPLGSLTTCRLCIPSVDTVHIIIVQYIIRTHREPLQSRHHERSRTPRAPPRMRRGRPAYACAASRECYGGGQAAARIRTSHRQCRVPDGAAIGRREIVASAAEVSCPFGEFGRLGC